MDLVFAPSQIETWPLERLRPYARNAKMHGDDQVAKIAASMAKFGWTVPCMVADDGELIAGHGRVLAQSRRLSLIEATTNVAVGYGLAVVTQIVAFPWIGLHASIGESLALGGRFVCISLLRSYALRRLFERWTDL